MASSDASPSIPLTLRDVLEQEHVALHGPLPADDGPDRLGAVVRAIHRVQPAALCLSGGGIRSASFSLGVLQGLAQRGALRGFHYLSTVSGGGYIGSWLSAWMTHESVESVVAQLAQGGSGAGEPEPAPVRHLRSYGNYLSPRRGVLSADAWTLAAIFVRNLFLHFLVLLPLLGGVLVWPALVVRSTAVSDATPLQRGLVLAAGLLLVARAIAHVERDLPSQGGQSPSARGFRSAFLVPLVLGALLVSLFWSWQAATDESGTWGWWAWGLVGAGVHLAGALAGTALRARDLRRRAAAGRADAPASTAGAAVTMAEWLLVAVVGFIAGAVVWVVLDRLLPDPVQYPAAFAWLAVPALLGAFQTATSVYVGLFSRWTSEDDREWWARAGAMSLLLAAAWLVTGGLAVYGPTALVQGRRWAENALGLGAVTGVATALVGFFSRSGPKGTLAAARGAWAAVGSAVLNLGAVAFLVALTTGAAYLVVLALAHIGGRVDLLDHGATYPWDVMAHVHPLWMLAVSGGLLALSAVVSWGAGVNRFSLHSLYGNRLVRAYLGASRRKRAPHRFTDFDPGDNLPMSQLGARFQGDQPRVLFPVLNLALNLVRGNRLAWQQRKAASFTVSPLHAGTRYLGYRPVGDYGGMTLGKAMTISGAAASPNMGYHSSPLVTLLMAFFNVRLGWWLGNPGEAGRRTWQRSQPRWGLGLLVEEFFGLTSDERGYVYLSDGGHFENLGLYEMVLRRAHRIVVVDASCDPRGELADLAGAVRKIRADLGVAIDFRGGVPTTQALGEAGFAIADIRYADVDRGGRDGLLLYLKPVVTGDEPIDVARYAATHGGEYAFPHESTGDQFFDEAQFESYRTLGRHTIARLERTLGSWASVQELFAAAAARQATRARTASQPDAAVPAAIVFAPPAIEAVTGTAEAHGSGAS